MYSRLGFTANTTRSPALMPRSRKCAANTRAFLAVSANDHRISLAEVPSARKMYASSSDEDLADTTSTMLRRLLSTFVVPQSVGVWCSVLCDGVAWRDT